MEYWPSGEFLGSNRADSWLLTTRTTTDRNKEMSWSKSCLLFKPIIMTAVDDCNRMKMNIVTLAANDELCDLLQQQADSYYIPLR